MTDTFVERRGPRRPETGEAPFETGEVFYSRTDNRGVILSGNYVFKRVSDYDWSELLGAPHKVIRHPDMPKGVFWLFWKELKEGVVTAAYVKNKAKDGLYYWVFAVVAPTEDGYLSARIKPASSRFPAVVSLYAKALEREQKEGLSPEQSATAILKDLKELGFDTYHEFIVDSVRLESEAECAQLGLKAPERFARNQDLLDLSEQLIKSTDALTAQFNVLNDIPRNLQIIASRKETAGGPLIVLSKNYDDLSRNMFNWFFQNVVGENNSFVQIAKNTQCALLLGSAATILLRCERQIHAERRAMEGVDVDRERQFLTELHETYAQQTHEAYDDIVVSAKRITRACQDISRMLTGLDTVRVAFKIEDARNNDPNGGIGGTIQQLADTQEKCDDLLQSMQDTALRMSEIAARLSQTSATDLPDVLLYGRQMADALGSQKAVPIPKAG